MSSAPVPVVEATDRTQWRAWLQQNCGTADEVWLVIPHRGSSTPGVTHREAIEEALCFGWIDSLARKHDAHSWRQRFSPRNPRSAWSRVNRELVEQLTAQGLMTSRGTAAVELAKRTGTWAMVAHAQNGVVPEDLRSRLNTDPAAAAAFDRLAPSAKRAALEWIARAVRPETRERRIARTVERAALNPRP
jgi:uncharacterized protein YdeI (YjbR/CyaY-like superfamily)